MQWRGLHEAICYYDTGEKVQRVKGWAYIGDGLFWARAGVGLVQWQNGRVLVALSGNLSFNIA